MDFQNPNDCLIEKSLSLEGVTAQLFTKDQTEGLSPSIDSLLDPRIFQIIARGRAAVEARLYDNQLPQDSKYLACVSSEESIFLVQGNGQPKDVDSIRY